jgi:hypothetical protein
VKTRPEYKLPVHFNCIAVLSQELRLLVLAWPYSAAAAATATATAAPTKDAGLYYLATDAR